MPRLGTSTLALVALIGAGMALGACAESRLRDQPDFGQAERQDIAAQIADPDAHYAGHPAPGSNGMRVDAAQERYVHGKVITPRPVETQQTLTGGNNGGGDNGGGDNGGGAPSAGQ